MFFNKFKTGEEFFLVDLDTVSEIRKLRKTRDPDTNSKFACENWWLEDDPAFFWGVLVYFWCANCLFSGRVTHLFRTLLNKFDILC